MPVLSAGVRGIRTPPASLLTSSAPGTIYIATGPDEKAVWLMAIVLS